MGSSLALAAFSIQIGPVRNERRKEKPMKVTVDVDCTPEEARRFLGLPDLTPVHQAYVETDAKGGDRGRHARKLRRHDDGLGPDERGRHEDVDVDAGRMGGRP